MSMFGNACETLQLDVSFFGQGDVAFLVLFFFRHRNLWMGHRAPLFLVLSVISAAHQQSLKCGRVFPLNVSVLFLFALGSTDQSKFRNHLDVFPMQFLAGHGHLLPIFLPAVQSCVFRLEVQIEVHLQPLWIGNYFFSLTFDNFVMLRSFLMPPIWCKVKWGGWRPWKIFFLDVLWSRATQFFLERQFVDVWGILQHWSQMQWFFYKFWEWNLVQRKVWQYFHQCQQVGLNLFQIFLVSTPKGALQ